MRELLNDLVGEVSSVKFEDIPGIQGYYLTQRPEYQAAVEVKASELREQEYQRMLTKLLSK